MFNTTTRTTMNTIINNNNNLQQRFLRKFSALNFTNKRKQKDEGLFPDIVLRAILCMLY